MELSDSDLAAMDAVVDGHATAEEAERVRSLTADSAAAAVFEQLRSDRSARVSAFASMEPDAAALERFHWRLGGAMADARSTERLRQRGGWGLSRVGSVAAACVAVGFFGGWIGRGRPAVAPVQDPGSTTPVVDNTQPSSNDIMVPVSNEYGQVVAFQKFHNSTDAQRFTEDLNRANSANPSGDDHVKLMSAEKY